MSTMCVCVHVYVHVCMLLQAVIDPESLHLSLFSLFLSILALIPQTGNDLNSLHHPPVNWQKVLLFSE